MCQYNLQSASTGELHMKPTRLLCSDARMAERLGKRCSGGHPHAHVAGTDTRKAGMYTNEFARAVAKGYERAVVGSIWTTYVAGEDRPAPEMDDEELVPHQEVQDQVGAEAITFASSVPKNLARTLRRFHQNLGHPRREDLVRHLRLAGATEQALKAAQSVECQTCRRHVHPLDIIYLYTIDRVKVTALSILDHASQGSIW